MTTEKRPTKWTDPKTGKKYVLRQREGDVANACKGCVGDNDYRLCALTPPCYGEKVWVDAESETTEKGA
jgi:hypothetical protein